MQDNLGKEIRLVIGSFACSTWDDANIDSAIDTPADGWSLSLFNPSMGHLPADVKSSAQVQIYYGQELILTGIIDDLTEAIGRNGRVIKINGRDLIGQLIDCSLPILNASQLTLEEIAGRFILNGDLGGLFSNIKVQDASWLRNKLSAEPSESVWDALIKSAQVTGQHVWAEADGTIVVGDPFADSYQVQTPLEFNFDWDKNNVLVAEYQENVAQVYSEIQILSQDQDAQKILAQGRGQTPYTFNRFKIVNTADVETQAEAQALLNKVIKDNDLEAYTLNCDVKGWLIDGKVWQTGWTVTLQSNVLIRANAKWVVMGRTLTLSRSNGMTTRLKLKRQGDWTQPLILKQESEEAKKKKRSTAEKKEKQDIRDTYGLDEDYRGTAQ